ncbi:MAG TPA: hypothetical protein DCM86_18920 [Verrucomicrobiales bacterium]|nr:hypothetical protein [Verrucomicrobiales bacterium]
MSARAIILGLLLIIVGLAAGLGYLLVRGIALAPSAAGEGPQTNVVTKVAVRKFNSTNYFVRASGFHWSSLESTNYATYIENLRAVDCPEETIHDIIIADVGKLYARRRAEVLGKREPAPFWKTESPYDRRQQQALHALEREQRTLIRQLLNVDLDTELAAMGVDTGVRPVDLGFLPEAKQELVRGVLDRYRQMEGVLRDAAGGIWGETDDENLRRLTRQEESELQSMLSPQEFENYLLRQSPLAAELRTSLNGFEPSEEEFRRIFSLRRSYEDAASDVSPGDDTASADGSGRIRADMKELLDGELKEALGESRWKQYEKFQEPSYQALNQVGERFNLPKGIADEAYEYMRIANEQVEKLRLNSDVEEDARAEALRKISQETSREVKRILGPDAYRVFRGAGGSYWLNQ